MAIFNGKEGRWVTTKEGKHRFIEGAEDPVEKRDRDIAEQEERTRKLTAEKQGKDDNKPEGKPIGSPWWFTDYRKGISYGYHKYPNGYFLEEYDQKTEKSTIKRISKEEFERGRGADHKKMAENDFSARISDVRSMPEKTLSNVKKKEDAYIDLINAMKKGGYQGSENKDYHDVISEYTKMMSRRHDLQHEKDATKARNDELIKLFNKATDRLKNEMSRSGNSLEKELAYGNFSKSDLTRIIKTFDTGVNQMGYGTTCKFLAFMALRNLDSDNFTKSGVRKYFKQIADISISDQALNAIMKSLG